MNEAYAVISVTDPHGGKTEYDYDDALRETKRTGADGLSTEWQYDARGNCTRIVRPGAAARTYQFDWHHKPIALVTEKGAEWRWQYDQAARLILQRDPEGRMTQLAYRDGLLDAIHYPNGAVVRFEHDEHRNIVQSMALR